MSKEFIRILSGLNGASIVRGVRLGPREMLRACHASHRAASPFEQLENLERKRCNDAFSSIPSAILGDILDSLIGDKNKTLQLSLSRSVDGRLPLHDAVALLAILVAVEPAEVLEIGTFMGDTTRAMAENLPAAIIHTVDLPPDFAKSDNSGESIPKDDFHLIHRRVVGREFNGLPLATRIRQHFGDTAQIDFREFGSPAFFFIDGSHTYEYCKQDSEKCFALCRGGGTFLWHDCDETHPGVVQFVNEWRALGRNLCRIAGTSLAFWNSAV